MAEVDNLSSFRFRFCFKKIFHLFYAVLSLVRPESEDRQ